MAGLNWKVPEPEYKATQECDPSAGSGAGMAGADSNPAPKRKPSTREQSLHKRLDTTSCSCIKPSSRPRAGPRRARHLSMETRSQPSTAETIPAIGHAAKWKPFSSSYLPQPLKGILGCRESSADTSVQHVSTRWTGMTIVRSRSLSFGPRGQQPHPFTAPSVTANTKS